MNLQVEHLKFVLPKLNSWSCKNRVGGARFGFCTKKPVKYDEKEESIRKHFEYIEFMWKERFWDFDIFVEFNPYVDFLYHDVQHEFKVILK
jgi:hypothetical protein